VNYLLYIGYQNFRKNQYLDKYIPGSTKELGGPQSYCDKGYSRGNNNQKHRIGAVMVSVLTSSAVDRGFEPRSGQTKDYKIGICSSPLSTQHYGERAKIGWLGIRIMCPNVKVIDSSFVEQVEEPGIYLFKY
jgi:hypothetical protein